MKVTKSQFKRVIKEELQAVLNEGKDVGGAVHHTLVQNRAQSPETAMDLAELFGDNGLVWAMLREWGISDKEIQQYGLPQKQEFYNSNGGRLASQSGDIVHWAKTGMRGQDKIYLDL